mmetsp:Transcript_2120/g.4545  ORF Transcript_2120/g.4545 Transcript_2120/m.4545 type:complete len:228 (+) Transcript_2120:567-1250(+)
MFIATVVHRKSYGQKEWAAAAAVCFGLILIGVSDASTSGASFSPYGLSLVSLSVVADAIMPNVQQRLFQRGESRANVVFFTNLVVSVGMLVSLGASGDLSGALGVAQSDATCAAMMLTYATVSYVAVSCHMTVVQRFGGVVGVLVGNGRKIVTIVLSFILFPKPVSALYAAGVLLSLGGLTSAVLVKEWSGKGSSDRTPKRTASGPSLSVDEDENNQKYRQPQNSHV